MNVTQNKIDNLNTVVSISIKPEDYKPKVEKALKDYQKRLNMPGFRKGKAPMGIIKKQYEGAVTFEEINKVLNESLSNYISENKLNILGQPLPKTNDNLDINANELTFDFELGLAPEFSVDLSKAKIDYYKIEASEKEINETIEKMQTQLGQIIDVDQIENGGHFSAQVEEIDENNQSIEEGIKTNITFIVDDLKNKDLFIGKKSGEIIEINAQEIFNDPHQLQHFLGLTHEQAHDFNGKLKIRIEKPSKRTKAEVNQELFDKVYGKDKVSSEQELREKIKEELEGYYKRESDNKFMNDSVEWLFENIKFDLPEEFLKKFIKNSSKEPLNDDEVNTEYEKSEKGLRYQLIEGQILSDNKISIQYNDLVEFTRDQMKQQFAMYGYNDIPEAELNKYVANAMKNEEQVRQASNNLIQQNLFNIFDKQIGKVEKIVPLEEFNSIIKEENSKSKI